MVYTFSLKWLDRGTDVSVVRQRKGEDGQYARF